MIVDSNHHIVGKGYRIKDYDCPCKEFNKDNSSESIIESTNDNWEVIDSNNGNLDNVENKDNQNESIDYHTYNEDIPHNHETQYKCMQTHQYEVVDGDNIHIGNAHKYPSKSNFNLRPQHSQWKR